MRLPKLLLFVISSIFLAGCWDSNEPERQFYIQGVGVDYQDGKYELYNQIISFGNVAKSEQINQDLIQAEIGHASGENLYELFFELYKSLDETLYWGHLSFLVLGEGALNSEQLNTILDLFTRFSDTRYTAWVYSTDDDIKDILMTVPALERAITLTKLSDPHNSYSQASFIDPVSIRHVILGLHEPSYVVKIPYVKMSKDWETEKGPDNITEIAGVGVVSRDGFKGFLKNDQAKGLQWMNNNTKRLQISFKDENKNNLSVILEDLSVNIEPIIKDKDVKFDIKIEANARINIAINHVTNDEIRENVQKQVKSQIEKTFLTSLEMNTDIFRLSEIIYRKDVQLWKDIQKDGHIPLTKDSIKNINVKLKQIITGRKKYLETIDSK